MDNRELSVSDSAWNKLSDSLDKDQGQNRAVIWLRIGSVAAVVMILAALSFYFSVEKGAIIEDQIVDSPETIQEDVVDDNSEMTEIKPTSLDSESAISAVEKENEYKIEERSQKEVLQNRNKNRSTISKQKVTIEKSVVEVNKEGTVETDQKVEEVVAQIMEIQKKNGGISEQEIEALLKKAEGDLAMNRNDITNSNTPSAETLLADVENELEESFRERVFKALKSGFENLKTTVAERNN